MNAVSIALRARSSFATIGGAPPAFARRYQVDFAMGEAGEELLEGDEIGLGLGSGSVVGVDHFVCASGALGLRWPCGGDEKDPPI